MNNCFDVSIRLCPTCGDSGDYVDDIPAISHNLIDALKDSDVKKFSEFFKQIKDAAYLRLKKDIEIKFNEGKKFNHIVAETSPFSVSRTHTLLTHDNIIGYYTRLPYHRFVEYHINKLGVFAHKAGEIEIFIIDLVTQEVLKKTTFEVKKGINNIPVNLVVENEYQVEVFVGIRQLTAVLSAMDCGEFHDCGCSEEFHSGCGCIEDCDDCCDTDYYGSLAPCDVYKKENIVKQDIKYFCLDATLKCSFENMICEYSEYFQEAYKYLVATFILNHKLNSYDRGWYSDANTQMVLEVTLPEIRDYYYKLLMLGIGNIREITNDSICWSCDQFTASRPLLQSFV